MVNLTRTLKTIWRGMNRLGDWLWNLLLTPSPFAPVMLFYTVAPALIVYLYLTNASTAGALDLIARRTGVTWWTPSAIFVVCSWLSYESRSARLNALLTLPLAGYALILLAMSLSLDLGAGSAVTALLLLVAAWSSLGLCRYYAEQAVLKKSVLALRAEIKAQAAGQPASVKAKDGDGDDGGMHGVQTA